MLADLTDYALVRHRAAFRNVLVASVLLNLIVFAGSIYMMLVYDSVLPSHSIPTLVSLFILLAILYGIQAVVDQVRARAMLAFGNAIYDRLVPRVRRATVARSISGGPGSGDRIQPLRDLDQVYNFFVGPGPMAFVDLPWVVVFLLVLFALHWALGVTALIGVAILIGIAVLTHRRTLDGTRELGSLTSARMGASQEAIKTAESAVAMGMLDRLTHRAHALDKDFLASQSRLTISVARLGGAGRIFRIFLQSLILTIGALLVIAGEASGGVILASSVLSGRALAPVDQALANWRGYNAASAGWDRLQELLAAEVRPAPPQVALPPPQQVLTVKDLYVAPPGAQHFALTGASFTLPAGAALAIIGPSAAGKSTLARALAGIWQPARGEIRLDGARYDQWDQELLGKHFGYVSQSVEMFDGTIGENIARFDPEATSDAIIAAARAAGMHETILGLADGYDTPISDRGGELSAGQRQRLGLARALFGDPFLIVLDEPNSNLDAAGDAALAHAIAGARSRGAIVVLVTHRTATLGPISHVLMLNQGRVEAFGERDAVLKKVLADPAQARPLQPVSSAGQR